MAGLAISEEFKEKNEFTALEGGVQDGSPGKGGWR